MQDYKPDKTIYFAILSLLKNSEDMFFIKSIDFRYICVSSCFASFLGYCDDTQLVGKSDAEIFKDKKVLAKILKEEQKIILSGKKSKPSIETFVDKNGVLRYLKTTKFPIFDTQNNIVGLYGITKDVTKEQVMQQHYARQVSALFTLPSNALAAVMFDMEKHCVIDSLALDMRANAIFSFSNFEDFIGGCASTVYNDNQLSDFFCCCNNNTLGEIFKSGKRMLTLEYQCKFEENYIIWVKNEMHFLTDPASGSLCVVVILYDINNEKLAASALVQAAEKDALTGIYNRDSTMKKINRFLNKEGKNGTHLLFMIDVDNFKYINDTLGHQTGDSALIYIANILKKVFHKHSIVGRIGGDEFFALLKNTPDDLASQSLAEKLIENLQCSYFEQGSDAKISVSVGVSKYSGDKKSLQTLYQEADTALYTAKRTGKNKFVFFDYSENL